MKLTVKNIKNLKHSEIELASEFILDEPNEGLVHQLLLLQHTRKRRAANSKTRTEVRGGGAKPWTQKGTGRARAGSRRSPLWRGGGVIFGPKPHLISVDMPRRARRKALCSALSLKLEQLLVLDKMPCFDKPKTKAAIETFAAVVGDCIKPLFLHDDGHENLELSLRNVTGFKVLHWRYLNPHDILNADKIVVDSATIVKIQDWLLSHNKSALLSAPGGDNV